MWLGFFPGAGNDGSTCEWQGWLCEASSWKWSEHAEVSDDSQARGAL